MEAGEGVRRSAAAIIIRSSPSSSSSTFCSCCFFFVCLVSSSADPVKSGARGSNRYSGSTTSIVVYVPVLFSNPIVSGGKYNSSNNAAEIRDEEDEGRVGGKLGVEEEDGVTREE